MMSITPLYLRKHSKWRVISPFLTSLGPARTLSVEYKAPICLTTAKSCSKSFLSWYNFLVDPPYWYSGRKIERLFSFIFLFFFFLDLSSLSLDWPQSWVIAKFHKEPHSGKTGTLCTHSSVMHDHCYHWLQWGQTKFLITQPSCERFTSIQDE